MGNKRYGRYWRATNMGNTVQGSVGVQEIKRKVQSYLQISFPTKKLPSTLPHQGPATSYSYV